MCLGQIAQVVERLDVATALVRTGGADQRVSLLLLGAPVAVGEWLVVHSGYALERITADQAHDATAIRATPVPTPDPPSADSQRNLP